MEEAPAVAITVVSRNYFHFAAAMHESLRATNPNIPLIVYLIDDFPADFQHPASTQELIQGGDSNFRIVPAKSIGIENWPRMSFQYTPFELACAVKPFATRHALANFGDKVLYCDADVAFSSSLSRVLDQLDRCNVLLTPHYISIDSSETSKLSGVQRGKTDEEYALIAQAGIFNAGFYAVKNSGETEKFLDWWCDRCRSLCYVSPTTGIFVDQSWLNFVPTLFDAVHVDRTPQLNVAYWNLNRRNLRQDSSKKWVVGEDAQPVTFFHFSGFDFDTPNALTKYHHLVTYATTPYGELCQSYADSVQRKTPDAYSQLGCQFDTFEDGADISPLWREALRGGATELDYFRDPWDTAVRKKLIRQLRSLENVATVSRLPWHLEELNSTTQNLHLELQRVNKRRSSSVLKRLARTFVPKKQARAA